MTNVAKQPGINILIMNAGAVTANTNFITTVYGTVRTYRNIGSYFSYLRGNWDSFTQLYILYE
jgi:hypothetical protein